MRIKLAFLLFVFAFFLACGRNNKEFQLPETVQAAFMAQFPNATNVEWHGEDDNFYAGFEVRGEEIMIGYHADGTRVKDNEPAIE